MPVMLITEIFMAPQYTCNNDNAHYYYYYLVIMAETDCCGGNRNGLHKLLQSGCGRVAVSLAV